MNQRQIFKIVLVHDIKYATSKAQTLHALCSKTICEKELSLVILSLVFLLISNLISWLRLHQFLGTKTTEANKSLKTDGNRAY